MARKAQRRDTFRMAQPPITIAEVRKSLASNVRRIRAGRFAQEALALEAGLDRTMVSKIERGVTSPSLESIVKIANVLGVGVHDLLQPAAEDPPAGKRRGL